MYGHKFSSAYPQLALKSKSKQCKLTTLSEAKCLKIIFLTYLPKDYQPKLFLKNSKIFGKYQILINTFYSSFFKVSFTQSTDKDNQETTWECHGLEDIHLIIFSFMMPAFLKYP